MVPHAGGKIHNFYIKELNKHSDLNIKLLSFCHISEKDKLDLDKYKIDNDITVRGEHPVKEIFFKIINQETKFNPINRYAGFVYNSEVISIYYKLLKLKKESYNPHVVILEWTQMVLLLPIVKKFFHEAKIISNEVDVASLGFERRYLKSAYAIQKFLKKIKWDKMMSLETKALETSDLVVLNNPKDEKIVKDMGIQTDTFVQCPYFQSMTYNIYYGNSHDILFYGAMRRQENWKSAVWFIENVMPGLADTDVRFVVIGNNPPKELLKFKSDKVLILGFVEDVSIYFQNALCLVAPLVLGAGIKIKIIEGLSAGIPILTNEIGIEGIPAIDGKDYLHCESPQDYIICIKKLINNEIDKMLISENSKKLIKHNYDYNICANELYYKIIELFRK